MFGRFRERMGRDLDIFAGIAAAAGLSAFLSASLIFGATDQAASATAARQTGVITAGGKGDRLCGQDWAAYDANCGRRILAREGRDVSVRVVGTRETVAERGMTGNERIRAAFAALEAAGAGGAKLAAGR